MAGGEQRVVGEDGADPDRDRVRFGPPAMDQLAAALAGDPGRVAGRGRGGAVERHRQLQRHQRQPGAGVLAERLVEEPGGGRLRPGRELDLDAAVAEDPGAAPGGLLGRVVGADHDPRDPGLEDRVGAGRLAAVVGAGLEGHVHRRPGRVLAAGPAVLERRPLGVELAEGRVEALADDLAVADETAPTSGFGLTRPRPPSASSSARSQMRPIRACELGVHSC